MLQPFNKDDGGVEAGVGRERKRNKKGEEKEENEREKGRLLIIKYSYMCEQSNASCGVSLFTDVHQMYFGYGVENQMEERFLNFVIYYRFTVGFT
jgi:hypothetical protein